MICMYVYSFIILIITALGRVSRGMAGEERRCQESRRRDRGEEGAGSDKAEERGEGRGTGTAPMRLRCVPMGLDHFVDRLANNK